MKIKVNKDMCFIEQNEIWNVGDYNVHTVEVDLSSDFDGLVNKVRYFIEDKSYDMLVVNNIAQVPYEATLQEGAIKIGVYGYDANTDILVQSTSPIEKYISSGSYTGNADNTEPLTPTDKEQMESQIQTNTNDIIDLKANKQDTLISGENIKTINDETILGSGNIEIIEDDPIFKQSPAYTITDNDITYWNNKANMSDIPDVSNFITKDVDDLTYYTKSTDMQNAIDSAVNTEKVLRENADVNLQNQIDAITVSSDVIDILGTYQELQNYDTSHVKANDIIKVLQDSTHNNAMSYYRWVITNHVGAWVYVGSEGPYYTKSESDVLLNAKQNEITSNNMLASDLVDDTNQTNQFVTTTEKTSWNNKLDQSDLADYVKNTDYATAQQGGVIKTGNALEVDANGIVSATVQSYADYGGGSNSDFISKGTLENVITGKSLETSNNKVTSISESSTDIQYPSAKCIYDSETNIQDDYNKKIDNLSTLSNLFEKITGTGTSVTLNDTSNTIMKLNLDTTTSSQVTTTGKNLFNESLLSTSTNGGLTWKYENQKIKLSGTATRDYSQSGKANINLQAGTYAFTLFGDSNLNFGVWLYNSNNQLIANSKLNNPFTINEEATSIGLFVEGLTVNTAYNLEINIQIERNSSTGTYEPYTGGQPAPSPSYPQTIHTISGDNAITISNSDNTKSQEYPINLGDIELCKIGDYPDVLFKNTINSEYYNSSLELNKWYLKNKIGKLVLDGNENYDRYSSLDTANYNCFYLTRNDFFVDSTGAINTTISNYFLGQSFNDRSNNIANMWVNKFASQLYFKVPNTITTSSELKTWLNTHNTTVYYIAASPTYTLLNDTLQTQLDNIQYALAYDTQTNISQTNNDLSFIINAETYAKINIVTSISSASTDNEIPTAKAVYNYIQSIS